MTGREIQVGMSFVPSHSHALEDTNFLSKIPDWESIRSVKSDVAVVPNRPRYPGIRLQRKAPH
jgi:hypothetical protein